MKKHLMIIGIEIVVIISAFLAWQHFIQNKNIPIQPHIIQNIKSTKSQQDSKIIKQNADERKDKDVLNIKGGAGIPLEQEIIKVIFPQKIVKNGKTYSIQWHNPANIGKEIYIRLIAKTSDNNGIERIVYDKFLVKGAKLQNKYNWKVSQPSYNKYQIEIWPKGAREIVGRSDFFSIKGGSPLIINKPSPEPPLQLDNIIVESPLPRQKVSNPIVIKGKARNIFTEGTFKINLMGYKYPINHPKYAGSSTIINSANAKIVDDCDWMTGEWCKFKAVIEYPLSEKWEENMLYFYDEGGKSNPQFIGALEVRLR